MKKKKWLYAIIILVVLIVLVATMLIITSSTSSILPIGKKQHRVELPEPLVIGLTEFALVKGVTFRNTKSNC
jgi:biopolymer transport protein ExbD